MKSFAFELILPFIIIILALFLLRVSFIRDLGAQELSLATYLTEKNPFPLPIGGDSAAVTASMNSGLSSRYGTQLNISIDTSDTTADTFDKNFLLPIKLG